MARTIPSNCRRRWAETRLAAASSLAPNHHNSSETPTIPASAVRMIPPASSRRQLTGRSRISMDGTRKAGYRKGKLSLYAPRMPPATHHAPPRPEHAPEVPGLKATLKRGALVAAANWPLVAVQFVAESTLKLLLAVPVVGGIFLVVLLLGANADELLAGDVSEIVAEVFAAMRQNVPAFIAFSLSFGIVLLGGSALTFVVKAGTVSLLATAEAKAG